MWTVPNRSTNKEQVSEFGICARERAFLNGVRWWVRSCQEGIQNPKRVESVFVKGSLPWQHRTWHEAPLGFDDGVLEMKVTQGYMNA